MFNILQLYAFYAYQVQWNSSELPLYGMYNDRWSIRFNALNSRQTFYRNARVGLVSFQHLLDRLFPYASIASYGRIKSMLGISVFFNPTTCWTKISLHCAGNFCIKNFYDFSFKFITEIKISGNLVFKTVQAYWPTLFITNARNNFILIKF